MTEKKLYLNVAELAVSASPTTVSTVLGSCVSVFLYSTERKVGGVTHYAMPDAPKDCSRDEGLRYGDIAIPYLIEELYQRYGVDVFELTAKIIGGANSENNGNASRIGLENVKLARKLLKFYGIAVKNESVGGPSGRKAIFHIPSGRVQVANIVKTQNPPIKVLIIDASLTIRQLLSQILTEDQRFEALPPVASTMEASEIIKKVRPDVITLDVQMPGKSGVKWLEQDLPQMLVPVVMITSLNLEDGNEVFRALELGAVDYTQKPSVTDIEITGPIIKDKIIAASRAKVLRSFIASNEAKLSSRTDTDLNKLIVIGASTGGIEAIKKIICQLPSTIPPILIVQHIPPDFSLAFANNLNSLCPFLVKEAEDGDEILAGKVLIAPGNKQMKIHCSVDGKISVRITNDAPMNRHRPSVDYLFNSVAEQLGPLAVGVILTGMGRDGAAGLLHLKETGATTLAQDEESCAVFGMPKAAFELGAVVKVVNLDQMAQAILEAVSKPVNNLSKRR